MNKLIGEQLKKVSVANLGNFDEATNTFFIPKFEQVKVAEDECYLIELNDSLLRHDDTSILESNWNCGRIPPTKYLKVDIIKVMGKMLKVNGVGFNYQTKTDTLDSWSGWLPLEYIKIIEKL